MSAWRSSPWDDRRTGAITLAVVTVHALAVWAIEQGWLARMPDDVQIAEIVLESVVPEAPAPAAPAPAPAPPRPPEPRPVVKPAVAPRPQPASRPEPPSQTDPAPVIASEQAGPQAPVVAAPAAVASTRSAEPAPGPVAPAPAPRVAAPAALVLPSADADYLDNPRPAYPRLSRRLGEQGTVIVRVLISVDGRAEQAELRTSSGFERLDQAALETVRRWRYVAGRRHGVPEAMWFNVPIRFVLE